jgi:SAM-dependent methyltransferase
MRSRTIHVTPLSAPTVTAPVASTPMAGADGNHDYQFAIHGNGNHDYLFAIYEQLRAERGPIRALDFGCGSGTLITRARERGFDDFLGAETYYGGQAMYAQSMSSIAGNNANWIMRIADDGKLPFPDQHFDFVCSNEVFEHVHNLGPVLDELARVTKPGGVHVHLFPTREKVIEAHLKVPLYPRVPARWRERYVRWFYERGIAAWSVQAPSFDEWWGNLGPFMRDEVFHRPWTEFEAVFRRRFEVRRREQDKLLFHLGQRRSKSFRVAARVFSILPAWLSSVMELRRAGAAVELRLILPPL